MEVGVMQVEFFTDAVVDPMASRAAGRSVFRDRQFVRITLPGGNEAVQFVTDGHRQRWPDEYERFQRRQRLADSGGRAVEDWPVPTRAEVEEMRELGLTTVEEVAALDDAALAELAEHGLDLRLLRERARAFVEAGKREALTSRLVAENDALRRENATLKGRIQGLLEQIERAQLAGLPPDRPGQGVMFETPRLPVMPARSALDSLAPPRRLRDDEEDDELPLLGGAVLPGVPGRAEEAAQPSRAADEAASNPAHAETDAEQNRGA
jgi:hypothetical protein